METGRLFFSYARADSEFVLKLAEDLRSNGTNLWLDQLDIRGGARWDRAVEEALHASPCLLVVLSPASVASNNVMDEVSFGLETDRRIVPILYKDCDIPFRLKRFQYIDFRTGYEDGFNRLIQALKLANEVSTRHKVEGGGSRAKSTPALFDPLGTGILILVLGAGLSFVFGPLGLVLMLGGLIFIVWGAFISWFKGSWSITFLIIGLIAGVLGLSGIAGPATQIAWILFVVFLVLFVVSFIMGRRPPV